ncbi:MAG TPA: CBS domain-containing protein [Desulfosalsimonadaceae bacterium]|nr:CBS domain-containing protein [Desulfosalsimonadaceae bacterium]
MASSNPPIIRVRDIMSKTLITINGMATAKEAADTMRAKQVSSLIVEKRHKDDAWGLIAVQDLIEGVIIPGRSFKEVHVYEIMTKPVIMVPADMDIRYAARLLHRAGIRRAPVEENRELIGMIAMRSLILDHDLF